MQGYEAGHSSLSNSDATNEWSYTSTLQVLVDYTGETLLYFPYIFCIVVVMYGAWGGVVVKALSY